MRNSVFRYECEFGNLKNLPVRRRRFDTHDQLALDKLWFYVNIWYAKAVLKRLRTRAAFTLSTTSHSLIGQSMASDFGPCLMLGVPNNTGWLMSNDYF